MSSTQRVVSGLDKSDNTTETPALDRAKGKYSKKILLLMAATLSLMFLLIILMTYFERANAIIQDTQTDYETINIIDELMIELLKIKNRLNNSFITGDAEQIEGFEQGTEIVQGELEILYVEWEGFIARADLVALKTDIRQIAVYLQNVINASDENRQAQLQLLSDANLLLEDVRTELESIRATLTLAMQSKHLANLGQFNQIKWAMVSLCAVSFALILFLFHTTIRNDQLNLRLANALANRNEELESRVLERTHELEGLAAYLTRINEEEKNRIARELHDEMGALLTAANMDASWIARNLNADEKKRFSTKISRLSENLKRGITLKRQITTSLVPPLLKELGLLEALEDMVANTRMILPETELKLLTPERLPEIDGEQELALYRICQESLTNIVKYASADQVSIRLSLSEGSVSLEIEDDGIGFDMQSRREGSHGLVGMRSRAAMFNGSLKVDSTPGQGTKISTTMQLVEQTN